MKKLSLVMLISVFFIYTTCIPQEGESGSPAQTREQLQRQETRLKSEEKDLEQQELTAQQQGNIQTAQSLEQQKQEVEQQISTVEQESASVPALGSSTSIGPNQEGSISVTSTITEQQIVAAQDISDWQQEFKAFTETPGRFWGKGGRLFTEVPANQRADRLVEIIQQSPDSLFAEDPLKGIDALKSIATLAEAMYSKKLFTPDEASRDYHKVMQALTDKAHSITKWIAFDQSNIFNEIGDYATLAQKVAGLPLSIRAPLETFIVDKLHSLIKDATFPKEKDYIDELRNFSELLKEILNVPPQLKGPLENAIIERINNYLGNFIADAEKTGATPEVLLEELGNEPGIVGSTSTVWDWIQSDTAFQSEPLKQAALKMLTEHLIGIFKRANLSNQSPEVFNRLTKILFTTTRDVPSLKDTIQSVIADKLTEYLTKIPTNLTPNEAFTTLTERYNRNIKSFNLSASDLQKVKEGREAAFEGITKQALSLPTEQALTTLLNMTTDENAKKFFNQSPESAQQLLTALDTAMLAALNNHALSHALLITDKGEAGSAQNSYLEAYDKQVEQLKNYLGFSQKLTQGSKTQIAVAQRITRLRDFAKAQKDLPLDKANKVALGKVSGKISGLSQEAFDGKGVPAFLAEYDPLFGPSDSPESTQKKLFALGPLIALPEDTLASLNHEASDLIDAISKTTDKEKLKELYAQLERIRKDLDSPLLKDGDKTYGYKDLLILPSDEALFNDLSQRISKALKSHTETLKENVGQLKDMSAQLEEVLPTLESASVEDIAESREMLDKISKTLEDMTSRALPEDETTVTLFKYTYGRVQAWRTIIDAAQAYKGLMQVNATEEAVAQAYSALINARSGIKVNLSYLEEENFPNRLLLMKEQKRALDKLSNLLEEHTIPIGKEQLNLMQVGKKIVERVYSEEDLPQETLQSLLSLGLVRKDTVIVEGKTITFYRSTEKGLYLGNIADTYNRVVSRSKQLEEYLSSHSASKEPSTIMLTPLGRPIELADTYKLNLMIVEDRVETLQNAYNRNTNPSTFNQAVAEVVDLTPEKPKELTVSEKKAQQGDTKYLLTEIRDILETQRSKLREAGISPYFEALIEFETQVLDLPEEERKAIDKRAALEETTTKILTVADPEAVSTINGPTAIKETKMIFKEMGQILNEALTYLVVRWKQAKIDARKKGGKVAWYSIVPATIVAFFTTKIALKYGTPLLFGGVGGVLFGPAGAAAGAAAGHYSSDLVSDVGALFAGAGAAIGLWILSDQDEVTTEMQKELNEKLIQAGYKPEEILQKDPNLFQRSIKKATRFLQTDVQKMSDDSDQLKQHFEAQLKVADQAQQRLYNLLDIEPNATALDVEAAFAKKKAELNKTFFLNRWLIKRRITHAYRFMLETRQDASRAQIEYNQVLAQITLKLVAEVAKADASTLQKVKGTLTGGAAWITKKIYNSLFGEKEETGVEKTPPLTKEQFSQIADALILMYKEQVADLMALEKEIEKRAETINKSTPFDDNTLTEVFRDVFNNRVKDLNETFQSGVDELLKERGYKPLNPSASTS